MHKRTSESLLKPRVGLLGRAMGTARKGQETAACLSPVSLARPSPVVHCRFPVCCDARPSLCLLPSCFAIGQPADTPFDLSCVARRLQASKLDRSKYDGPSLSLSARLFLPTQLTCARAGSSPLVTVISPTGYFTFTPLLASTSVGTLEYRCALEPVRRLKNVNFACARAHSIGSLSSSPLFSSNGQH
jgi:hypothetical protein